MRCATCITPFAIVQTALTNFKQQHQKVIITTPCRRPFKNDARLLKIKRIIGYPSLTQHKFLKMVSGHPVIINVLKYFSFGFELRKCHESLLYL